ncbi:MAG: hypothetical protein ABW318_13250 [Vicinamibacterales bacterium]
MRMYQVTVSRSVAFAFAFVCATAGTADAQWLSLPIPGTPRTPDGKPNLTAPAPHTTDGKPDHSGIWKLDTSGHNPNYNLLAKGTDAPMLPWAAELFKRRVATHGYDRPMTVCLPHGVPDGLTSPYGFKLIQTPLLTVHLYEEFTMYRQIHTDGRKLPVDPNPQYYGYSIGRWEGETFVVESAGFKEGSWLDNDGHPHTESLRTTERFRRVNFGKMEVAVTIDDPGAYSRPWTAETMRLNLQPDTEMLEHLCENNRDLERLQRIWNDKQPAGPSAKPAGR